MGLRDFFRGRETIRDLRAEVGALTCQRDLARRELTELRERVSQAERETRILERSRACDLERERSGRERELFAALAPLLLNLPTARRSVERNPALLARDMIGLFQPADDFLAVLGLEAIGPVGASVPYDGAVHDCAGAPEAGSPVRIVTVGYRRGGEIWAKARVKEL